MFGCVYANTTDSQSFSEYLQPIDDHSSLRSCGGSSTSDSVELNDDCISCVFPWILPPATLDAIETGRPYNTLYNLGSVTELTDIQNATTDYNEKIQEFDKLKDKLIFIKGTEKETNVCTQKREAAEKGLADTDLSIRSAENQLTLKKVAVENASSFWDRLGYENKEKEAALQLQLQLKSQLLEDERIRREQQEELTRLEENERVAREKEKEEKDRVAAEHKKEQENRAERREKDRRERREKDNQELLELDVDAWIKKLCDPPFFMKNDYSSLKEFAEREKIDKCTNDGPANDFFPLNKKYAAKVLLQRLENPEQFEDLLQTQ